MNPSDTTEPEAKLAPPILVLDFEAIAGELRRDEQWAARGHSARTLAKHSDLRIVLVAMKAGGRIHEHQTEARFSIQTLQGRIRVQVGGESTELPPGKLLVVDKLLPHAVEAQEDSTFLLSLFWPKH